MEVSIIHFIIIISIIVGLATVRSFLEKKGRWARLFRALGFAEAAFAALLLGGLIVFGCLQIILRNFFQRGILWADPLMRHLVLWLGMIGGSIASSQLKHINIDILTRFLPERMKAARDRIIFTATALASTVLGTAALKLVLDERSYGEKSFLNIDTWILQLILPGAFFLIAYRSAFRAMIKTVPGPAASGHDEKIHEHEP